MSESKDANVFSELLLLSFLKKTAAVRQTYLPVTFEDKVRPAHDAVGVKASAVASTGVDGEGGVLTDGVRVVVVVALPGVVVVVEDEVTGEEEDLGTNLAALTHPLTVQPDGQVGPWRQDGRVELIGAVDDATGDAAVVMILKSKTRGSFDDEIQKQQTKK